MECLFHVAAQMSAKNLQLKIHRENGGNFWDGAFNNQPDIYTLHSGYIHV